jgi:hypothetical protein
MGMSCVICNHSKRLEIDRALMAGRSLAGIAREYNVSESSLTNHRDNHISRQLIQAWEKKELMEGMNVLEELEQLIHRTKKILDEAERTKKYGIALSAVRETRGTFELMSKIAYSLHQAKLTELELERSKEQAEQADSEAYVQESLQILSFDELKVFNKLIQKIHIQDRDMNCLTIRNRRWPTADEKQEKEDNQNNGVLRRTKGRAIPNTGQEVNSQQNQAKPTTFKDLDDGDLGDEMDGVKPVPATPISKNWRGLKRSYG